MSLRLALFIVPFLVSGSVTAQDVADLSGCRSVGGSYCVPSGGAVVLKNVSGTVAILRNTSVIDGLAGASLMSGDRVVLQEGSGLIVLGPTCKISLGNFSSARISASGGATCMTLGVATQTLTNDATNGTVLAGAAAVGVGALAAGLSGGGGSSGSP